VNTLHELPRKVTHLIRYFVVAMLLSIAGTSYAVESIFSKGPTPLPLAEAFVIEIGEVGSDAVTIDIKIADEYYLYKKRFEFAANSDAIELLTPIIHEDEFFGKSDVFRNELAIVVPFKTTATQNQFDLTLAYQGCADMGLCYPPTKKTFNVSIPAAPIEKTSKKNNASQQH